MNRYHLNEECTCGSTIGYVEQSGPHNKLYCEKCKRYIKFISQKELNKLSPVAGGVPEQITLEEINFKLDLILDHLGIKC